MFGAIRPSSQRVMGVAVRTVVAMVGFGVHSAQAGETIVKPDQAYACTSLTRQPDSLNYVERLFANDGTYIFAWSRSESIKNAVETQRNEHGEWLSFGRWKVIPTANGGSTLEVSEDIRYHYSDRSWHLPSESARPAFVVETVSIGATANRLETDMRPKRRGEAVPASTDGSGFTSTVKGQDYFTCIKRPGLTADKQELWRNVTPKAVEAKNTLEQRKGSREAANRQQDQNASQVRQQAIQDRAEVVQAGTTARQPTPNAQPSQVSKGEWKPIEISIAKGGDGSKEVDGFTEKGKPVYFTFAATKGQRIHLSVNSPNNNAGLEVQLNGRQVVEPSKEANFVAEDMGGSQYLILVGTHKEPTKFRLVVLTSGSDQARMPAQAPISTKPSVTRILSCFNNVGTAQEMDQYTYFSDGTFAETSWFSGMPTSLIVGTYQQDGGVFKRVRVSKMDLASGKNQWVRMPVVVEMADRITEINTSEAKLVRIMVRNNGVDKTSEFLGKDGYVRMCRREESDVQQRQRAETGRQGVPLNMFGR